MNKFLKIISIISISLISVFTLTGCPSAKVSKNVTEIDSGNMTINIEKGYKFVDIKIGLDTRRSNIENVYMYTLTKNVKFLRSLKHINWI